MTQEFEKKVIKQCEFWESLLTEIKLKRKEGTQMTLVKVKRGENSIDPICVTDATVPFGKVTVRPFTGRNEVKRVGEQTI